MKLKLQSWGNPIESEGTLTRNGRLTASLDGRRYSAAFFRHGLELTVIARTGDAGGGTFHFGLIDPVAAAGDAVGDGGRRTAPMPGRIVSVLVAAGASVEKGQPLLVLEAMKMEHTIRAPIAGSVTGLPFAPGDQVEEGAALVGFDPA